MKIVYLVRHAQASFGAQDYDELSHTGREQAQHLGQFFNTHGLKFDQIFSGTMKRHRQTADLMFPQARDKTQLPGWNEFDHQTILKRANPELSPKDLAEMSNQEIKTLFVQAFQRWVVGEHNDYSESWQNFKARVIQAIAKTFAQTRDKSVVITSGGAISVVIGHCYGMDESHTLELNWRLVNTGITKICVKNESTQVLTVNEHQHLDTEQFQRLITYR